MIQSLINQGAIRFVTLIDMCVTSMYWCLAPLGVMGIVDRAVAIIHSIVFAFARALSAVAKVIDGVIDACLRLSPLYS